MPLKRVFRLINWESFTLLYTVHVRILIYKYTCIYRKAQLEVRSNRRGPLCHLFLSFIVDRLHLWAECLWAHCSSVYLLEVDALVVKALQVVLLQLVSPRLVEGLLSLKPFFLLGLQPGEGGREGGEWEREREYIIGSIPPSQISPLCHTSLARQVQQHLGSSWAPQ